MAAGWWHRRQRALGWHPHASTCWWSKTLDSNFGGQGVMPKKSLVRIKNQRMHGLFYSKEEEEEEEEVWQFHTSQGYLMSQSPQQMCNLIIQQNQSILLLGFAKKNRKLVIPIRRRSFFSKPKHKQTATNTPNSQGKTTPLSQLRHQATVTWVTEVDHVGPMKRPRWGSGRGEKRPPRGCALLVLLSFLLIDL